MHKVTPSVDMIHCSASQELIYLAARRCYSDAEGWVKLHMSEEDAEHKNKLIRGCIKSGHDSVLEHITFSWHITCSRAASHQLVRHRIASYSQQSQRYVEVEDLPFVVPDFSYLGENKDRAENLIWSCSRIIEEYYRSLIDLGAKPEDARSVLHQATATHMIVTMNVRSLMNFFAHRCCYRAQTEIREIANQMLDYCKMTLPIVFENAGPKCIKNGKCTEHKPCGKAPWKKAGDNHDSH